MTTILVPLDGSPIAELGLRPAVRVAAETGAELVLLHAVPFLSAAQGEERARERAEIHESLTYLAEVQQRLADQGVKARTQILPGDPVRAILFAAEAERVELIAMATHGHSGVLDRLLGSVTAAVLRTANRPVLVTRADAPPREEAGPLRTILVGLDGTTFAEAGLSYLAASGLGREATILLVRAMEPGPAGPAVGVVSAEGADRRLAEAQQLAARHLQDAEDYLRATAAVRLPGRHCRVVAATGEPAAILLDLTRGEQADLVVMTTHDRRGVDRLLHGSVAQGVLRHSEAPVLILHGPAADHAPEAAATTPS